MGREELKIGGGFGMGWGEQDLRGRKRVISGLGIGNFIAALRDHDTGANGRPDIDR
jgi:hypothetical protein